MAIFLQIPEIPGDSLDSAHKGWMDIDALTHSFAQPKGGVSSQRRSATPSAGSFELVKAVDLATIGIQRAMLSGKSLPKATIHLTRRGAQADATYLSYELQNCSIQHWELEASESGVAISRLELAFEQIKSSFTPTSVRGREGSAVDFAWNFRTNQET